MIALNIRQPESGTARSLEEAVELGRRIGYPVMVRPSLCWAAAAWKSFTMKKT